MRLEKIEQNFFEKFFLEGNNLPPTEARFVRITKIFPQTFKQRLIEDNVPNLNQEFTSIKSALDFLEKTTNSVLTDAENTTVTPMKSSEGKVEIEPGSFIHNTSSNIETLRLISKSAFLASEWFGIFEFEEEGRFCTFASKLVDQNDNSIHERRRKSSQSAQFPKHYLSRPDNKQSVVFYLDKNNPIMQKLARLDFFEYARRAKESPEEIQTFYSAEEINMFEKLIRPLSKRGMSYHTKQNKEQMFFDWVAIPGAIPVELVNGICINNQNKTLLENIEQISKMFPNATIFDQEEKILRLAHVLDKEHEGEL